MTKLTCFQKTIFVLFCITTAYTALTMLPRQSSEIKAVGLEAPTEQRAPFETGRYYGPYLFSCDSDKKLSVDYRQVDSSPGDGIIAFPETNTHIDIYRDGEEEPITMTLVSRDGELQTLATQDASGVFVVNEPGYTASLFMNGKITHSGCARVYKQE